MPTSLPDLAGADVVDLVVAAILLLYVLEDLRRGVLYGLLDLAALATALLAGLLLFATVASFLVERFGLAYALAKPAAFGLIWLLSDLLFGLTLRRLLARPARAVAAYPLGRLLGGLTGAARAVLVVLLASAVVGALPLPEPVTRAVRDSRSAAYLGDRGAALQRALAGVLGDAVQETLGLLTVRPESSERVNLRSKVTNGRVDETAEARMLELLNQARSRAGLVPLAIDDTIRQIARAYSAEMFRGGFFSHVDLEGATPFDRMRRGGAQFAAAGENLALAPTVDVAHEGLMNSPGHRANILNARFRRVGIGVVDGGLHGRMFTQNFAD